MARLFAGMLSEALRPLDLAPAPFAILLELWQGDGLTQRDIVKRLEIEQATAANTLARMERDGLIRRVPDPHDSRARQILLTDKALKLSGPATNRAREVNRQALAGLDEHERTLFLSLMQRVIARQRNHLAHLATRASLQDTSH